MSSKATTEYKANDPIDFVLDISASDGSSLAGASAKAYLQDPSGNVTDLGVISVDADDETGTGLIDADVTDETGEWRIISEVTLASTKTYTGETLIFEIVARFG